MAGELLRGFQTGFGISGAIRDRRRQERLDEILLEFKEGEASRQERSLQIQEREEQLELKKLDFTARSTMLKMAQETDPALMDAQVDLFYQTLGGDPKSDSAKQFKKILKGINDDTRRNLVNVLENVGGNLPPGTVANFAKAIANNRITVPQAIAEIEKLGTRQAVKSGASSREVLEQTGDIGTATALQGFEAGEVDAEIRGRFAEALGEHASSVTSELTESVSAAVAATGFADRIGINSGRRHPLLNEKVGGAKHSMHLPNEGGLGRAFDLNVSELSKDERVQLIEELSSQGITGFGIGKNILHVDTGKRRAWGYHKNGKPNAPVPDWAKGAIDNHLAKSNIDRKDPQRIAFLGRIKKINELLAVAPPGSDEAKDLRARQTTLMNSPEGLRYKEDLKTQAEIEAAGPTAKAKAVGEAEGERAAPVKPSIAQLWGRKPGERISEQEAAEQGLFVPDKETAVDLRKRELALEKVLRSSAKLIDIANQKPEAVGFTGSFASGISSLVAQGENIVRLIPGAKEYMPIGGEETAKSIFEQAGITNAKMQSELVNLVFQAAALAGQSGHGVSNRDIENFSRQVAAGAQNPDAMKAVIRAFALSQSASVRDAFKVHTGADRDFGVPEGFGDLSDATLGELVGTGDNPSALLKLLTDDQLSDLELEVRSRASGRNR